MTNEQKIRIASLRRAGLGYTAIAREIGLTKSAISNYCRGNGLGSIIEGKGKNDLQKFSVRVITKCFSHHALSGIPRFPSS
ncbi:MAG: helix-turn-helix domain-containing protein [Anaerolineaceae bacterium]|nr:helix-turn-helix domain-containing protein [Anaerolineaceae bacterium]